jgi:hypothetical protein
MKIIRTVAIAAAGGVLLAGCGRAGAATPQTAPTAPTTLSTTMATLEATTTTTACVPDGTAAATAQQTLRAVQATLDANVTGRRQIDGSLAQIQLTIDNTGRQIEISQRNVVVVQDDYEHAAVVFSILGTDTARAAVASQANYLADAQATLASWVALRTKSLGDLARMKVSATDYDKAINEDRGLVAAAQQQVTLSATPSC